MVSDTTRAPRDGEINGVHYNFITLEEFRHKEKAGLYTIPHEYNGEWYADLLPPKDAAIVIFEVTIEAAMELKTDLYPDLIIIWFQPEGSTIDEQIALLETRLRGRNSETPESLARRLKKAREEIPAGLENVSPGFLFVNACSDDTAEVLLPLLS
jgi:guanylate kinase